MKLSFLPGQLYLEKFGTHFIVTLAGQELIRTPFERYALQKFNSVRKELEEKFPPQELTSEQKQEALKRLVQDIVHTEVRNNQKNPNRFKSGIPKTRTFG